MYKNVIKLKDNLPAFMYIDLCAVANKAFNNRAGKIVNTSSFSSELVFAGNKGDYGCLIVGVMSLKKNKDFLSCVKSWQWIDINPSESCDVLKIFATPVR